LLGIITMVERRIGGKCPDCGSPIRGRSAPKEWESTLPDREAKAGSGLGEPV
jgi:hypothetical protein